MAREDHRCFAQEEVAARNSPKEGADQFLASVTFVLGLPEVSAPTSVRGTRPRSPQWSTCFLAEVQTKNGSNQILDNVDLSIVCLRVLGLVFDVRAAAAPSCVNVIM